jgi:hypothetical protein
MIMQPRFPNPDNKKDEVCFKCKAELGSDTVVGFRAMPGPKYKRPDDMLMMMSSQTQFFCLDCYQEFVCRPGGDS